MACESGPPYSYCLASGGWCGCNCKCCFPCPCWTKFTYKILHGTPGPYLSTTCADICAGGNPAVAIGCVFLRGRNAVSSQSGFPCTGINPSDPNYPNDPIYYGMVSELELTFDGCCMFGSPTSFTTVGAGTLTATTVNICGASQVAQLLLNGTPSSLSVSDCTAVTVTLDGSGPCCESCIVLSTSTYVDKCGTGDNDPCVGCREGMPVRVWNQRTQKIVSVKKHALLSNIRKRMVKA